MSSDLHTYRFSLMEGQIEIFIDRRVLLEKINNEFRS